MCVCWEETKNRDRRKNAGWPFVADYILGIELVRFATAVWMGSSLSKKVSKDR